MADSTTVTARLPRKLVTELERLAKHERRSRSFVVREAVEAYIGERDASLAAIDRGLADMRAGRVVPHSQVKAWVDSWGTEAELPMPKARKRARRRAA